MVGIDIGGSHIAAAFIADDQELASKLVITRKNFDTKSSCDVIVNAISDCIKSLIHSSNDLKAIGIAMPGPFDYENGISKIQGVGGKFEPIFGLHLHEALKDTLGLQKTAIHFFNDAHCFARGAWSKYKLESKKPVFLTIGTGFGSAFMHDGNLQKIFSENNSIDGFYNQPFQNGIADDYFSSRWFLNEYEKRTGQTISTVKELAEQNSTIAKELFIEFGTNLGAFLNKWLPEYQCDELIIGGNIAMASVFFEDSLKKELHAGSNGGINVLFCNDTEECIIAGAALLSDEKRKEPTSPVTNKHKRKSIQPVLPVEMSDSSEGEYNVFPFISSGMNVRKGYEKLVEKIADSKVLLIDGYIGVFWEDFRRNIHKHLRRKNLKVRWYDINSALKSTAIIDNLVKDSLNGDDQLFGKKYKGSLIDLFDEEKLKLLQPDPSADISVLYGTGAGLANWKGTFIYLDVPKNEIQYRMRAGSITNIGKTNADIPTAMYKRFYFVEWPMLSKHKEQVLPEIDYIVDAQRLDEITWMNGSDFRNVLNNIFQQPFRARPWFEAGVWGGNWMKNNFRGLNDREINYAWSFELITPENGIVLEGDGYLLEVSFDFLLFYNNKKLLGKAATRFGNEFPIRFNFLDTYVGGNLSVQCHPRTDYIRERFGENFTQDETYYILDCEPGAKVYLGFQEDIDPTTFKAALLDAQQKGVELPVEKYVQVRDAQQHDLFLIPNGTIHASGKNNLVLEISSTPYIFTFKMYDWLRLDLNGHPRPINIEHAFNNLYFDRKGEYVNSHLISKPEVEEEWNEGRKLKLPTHEIHFYSIYRYEFTGSVSINTNGQCHICMVVQGDQAEVIVDGKTTLFSYAETFVIPAAIENYKVVNQTNEKIFLIVAYVKDSAC